VTRVLAESPSRRDEHKKRTRQALCEAALDLFSTQGYDATTTEQITERAGVSPRTFFRYFPTKESVVYNDETAWVQTFGQRLPLQATSVSDFDAMRATFVDITSMHMGRRTALAQYRKALASSVKLRGCEDDHQRDSIVRIATAIAARHGKASPGERELMLGELGIMTYWRAVGIWLNARARADLGHVVAREFDLLAAVVVDH
jgi:AcrR family transcriptional regulator